jgi:putative two-component system response regulator
MPSYGESPPIKVLIVDDDAAFSRSMRRILIGAGYDCSEAASGAEARERLEDEDISAALCDVRMPGESGLDLLASLAADFPEVAVVMTTGVDDPPTAALAFEIGAYGYLIKPFTTNELCITLAGALRRRELEEARRSHLSGLERTVTRLRSVPGVVSHLESGSPRFPGDDEAETTEWLKRAVSPHDEETGAHVERMSRFSAILAGAVGFDNCTAEEFRLAAALHDVGNIAVPESILSKQGELTPDERRAVQRHARIGFQLLAGSTSPLLRVAAAIALAHHEWWDGSGYPRGLQGEDIPLEARIVAVADAFDDLTSHRISRPAVPAEAAMAAMNALRALRFEPRLLDVFGGLLEETEAIRAAHPDRTGEPPIRVLVVDSDETFARGLLLILRAEPTVTVVGTAGNAAEAEKMAVACEPDVVLVDFQMPDGEGVRVTEAIRAVAPDAQVVMLTEQHHPASMRAVAAGCAGFVARTAAADVLIGAIHSVHEGDAPSPLVAPPPIDRGLSPTSRGLGSDLGPRELEVLRLMAAGVPNKALAEQLFISLNTVRNHVQSILYKLDAHSKLEAVATALREGIIDLDQHVRSTP